MSIRTRSIDREVSLDHFDEHDSWSFKVPVAWQREWGLATTGTVRGSRRILIVEIATESDSADGKLELRWGDGPLQHDDLWFDDEKKCLTWHFRPGVRSNQARFTVSVIEP